MADSQVPGARDTRGMGERRRRRVAERSGQVDLDATMSQWPVTEPPTTPRPVVRPARPTLEGVATAPVLPTPGAMVVGPLLEARSAAAPRGATDGGRRSRRADRTGGGPAATTGVPTRDLYLDPDLDSDDTPTGPQATVPASTPHPTGTGSRAAGSHVPVGATAPRVLTPRPSGRGRGGRGQRMGGRRLLVLAAALLAAVLAAVLLLVLRPDDDPAQAVEPEPGPVAQQTLALTLAEATGDGLVGGALLGVDPTSLSTLLLPEDLLLTVPDADPQSLTEAADLGDETLRRGLEDTLLLRVDEVVQLAPAQLAAVVDGVGGVPVDVTDEVVTDGVLVAVGEDQTLTGAQAAAYASLTVDGEPVEARLARLGAVVQGLLAALPEEPADLRPVLEAAGVPAASEGPPAEEVVEVLAAAAARAGAGDSEQVVLPTDQLVAGAAARRGLDDEAARPELDRRFAGAQLPVAAVGEVRVLVRNGVGRPRLAAAARDLLVADGLRFAGSGNTPTFGDQPRTTVLVPSQSEEDRDRGEAVAAALGLDDTSLLVNSETLVDTDVVVVLGDDFARAVAEQTAGTGTTPATTPTGEAP